LRWWRWLALRLEFGFYFLMTCLQWFLNSLQSATDFEVETQTSLSWRDAALLFCQSASILQSEDTPFTWCRNADLSVTNANLLQSTDTALAGNRDAAHLSCQDASQRILKRRGLRSGDVALTLLKWRRIQGGDMDFSLLKRRGSVKRKTHALGALSRVWRNLKRRCSL